MEQGFKDGGQEAANHLLRDPISNRWNTEGAKLRLIFRDEVASERVRLKGTGLEIPPQRPEIIVKVGFEHFEADLVDSRGATVALDSFEAGQPQPVGDTSRQGVGFEDLGHEKFSSNETAEPDPTPVLGMFLSQRPSSPKEDGRAILRLHSAS
jgi:hypothetical protein